jgi:alpha-L-fucosidase 2
MTANDLYYTSPAREWLQGLPLGNGRLGAMVLADHARVRLQINDSTAWSGSPASEHRRGTVDAGTAAAALARARAAIAEGRPVDAEADLAALQARYSQAYLPFADLLIEIPGSGALAERGLSLGTATHSSLHGARANGIRQETFVSAPDQVLVHRLRSESPTDVILRLQTPLRLAHCTSEPTRLALQLHLPADVAPGHEPDEPPLMWELPGITPLAGAAVVALTHDGQIRTTGEGDGHGHGDGRSEGEGAAVILSGVTELVLVLATSTTFTGPGQPPGGSAENCAAVAAERASAALKRGFAQLRADHVAAHRELFDRVTLVLEPSPDLQLRDSQLPDAQTPERQLQDQPGPTDQRLMAAAEHPGGAPAADPGLVKLLFDYGRYLLISSSRPGTLPATLQGIWNDALQPPWSSNYTLNINTEMNYWGAEAANLSECHEPLLDLVEALAERGRATAQTLYGTRGWVAHHNSDAWAFTSPTSGHASWSHWPMAGVWLVCQLDERRRFGSATPDEIRRVWSLAVGAAEFACDWLLDDGGPTLETRPSTSPENCYLSGQGRAAVTTSTGMDRALLSWLFDTVDALARHLGEQDHPIVRESAAARARIAPPAISSGAILEWGPSHPETEPDHRHVSHLVFAYPGATPLSHGLREATATSLDRRGDDSTGWSLIWKLCLRARLRQPERVADLLRLMFRPVAITAVGQSGGLYPNLLAAHPPFQIDANLGFIAAVTEMLVQSDTKELRILPALPAELASGRVSGLVARPGISVDLRWEHGVVVELSLAPRNSAAEGLHQVCIGDWTGSVELRPGYLTRLVAAGNGFPARLVPLPNAGAQHCADAQTNGEADERAVKDGQPHGEADGGAHQAADPQRFVHRH